MRSTRIRVKPARVLMSHEQLTRGAGIWAEKVFWLNLNGSGSSVRTFAADAESSGRIMKQRSVNVNSPCFDCLIDVKDACFVSLFGQFSTTVLQPHCLRTSVGVFKPPSGPQRLTEAPLDQYNPRYLHFHWRTDSFSVSCFSLPRGWSCAREAPASVAPLRRDERGPQTADSLPSLYGSRRARR